MVTQLHEYESSRRSGKTQKESKNTRLNMKNTVKSPISRTPSNQRVNAFNYFKYNIIHKGEREIKREKKEIYQRENPGEREANKPRIQAPSMRTDASAESQALCLGARERK